MNRFIKAEKKNTQASMEKGPNRSKTTSEKTLFCTCTHTLNPGDWRLLSAPPKAANKDSGQLLLGSVSIKGRTTPRSPSHTHTHTHTLCQLPPLRVCDCP
ncbi:hypothetical protein BDA96_06G210700 [Sorghum bicolor]|uniref:Uncharacterized protein n=1 Tax=Sorghum bicolor TaxID=4558 RepID=A0A921QSW7_SORBI|nr:hypothetical protein BDA96_06G210700 [Sorghum bicolor]